MARLAHAKNTAMNDVTTEFAANLEKLLGIPREKALQYANAIGDTPEIDDDGRVVIRDFLTNEIMERVSIPGILEFEPEPG